MRWSSPLLTLGRVLGLGALGLTLASGCTDPEQEDDDAETTGPPIGILPAATYVRGETRLGAGDMLVLYTDGITEPEDPDDEEYGLERLRQVCRRHRDRDLDQVAAAIANDLEDFVRGQPFPDDRTLVIARRL